MLALRRLRRLSGRGISAWRGNHAVHGESLSIGMRHTKPLPLRLNLTWNPLACTVANFKSLFLRLIDFPFGDWKSFLLKRKIKSHLDTCAEEFPSKDFPERVGPALFFHRRREGKILASSFSMFCRRRLSNADIAMLSVEILEISIKTHRIRRNIAADVRPQHAK